MNNYNLIKIYEREIYINLDKLSSLISSIKIDKDSYIKIIVLSQMEKLITDTEEKIRKYQISSENLPSSKIREFQQKFNLIKNKYDSLSKNNYNKYEKFDNNIDEETHKFTSNSLNKIQLATKNTIEMESITGDILGDLNNHTEKMRGVKTKLGILDTDLNSSNSLLGKIIGKQNDDMKIIIIVGGFLFFIIICFFIYKIIKKFG